MKYQLKLNPYKTCFSAIALTAGILLGAPQTDPQGNSYDDVVVPVSNNTYRLINSNNVIYSYWLDADNAAPAFDSNGALTSVPVRTHSYTESITLTEFEDINVKFLRFYDDCYSNYLKLFL